MGVDNSSNKYVVWVYGECNILTNLLQGLAMFKRKMGQYWPRKLMVQDNNRLSMGAGEDIQIVRKKWSLIYGLYFSMHRPIPDEHDGKRTPTVLPCGREPVGQAFRDR